MKVHSIFSEPLNINKKSSIIEQNIEEKLDVSTSQIHVISEEISEGPTEIPKEEIKRQIWTANIKPYEKKTRQYKKRDKIGRAHV